MSYFKWDEIIKTHIYEIDEQHKRLVDMTNVLHDAIQKGIAGEIEKKLLVDIADYIKLHFETEEKIIEKNSPDEYEQHKKQHAILIEKIRKILQTYTPGNVDGPTQLFDVLRYWVVQHIKKNDTRYVK